MDHASLYRFISQCRYGVVSSTTANGTSQSALVGIAVTSSLEIVFDTLTSSRKYANLIERPACSFVVGWSGEQTVQLEGLAEAATGAELERCQAAYFAAWPEGRARIHWSGIVYFVVKPEWIRYSDYDQSPPLIEEFTFQH